MTPSSPDEGPRPFAVLTGPTASGKGAVAHALALLAGLEIASMDSMKVYRELDIATAKPSPESRKAVRYHLIDIRDPDVEFSVAEYLMLLRQTLKDLEAAGRKAVLSGGTPLYLKACIDGLRQGPAADWSLRSRWLEQARLEGPEALHRRLAELDPVAADRVHSRDLRRIVRALEVAETTGRAISEEWRWHDASRRRVPLRIFGLAWERADLYRRVDRRVEEMAERGLLEEAVRLRDRQPPVSRSASQSIGYKETVAGLSEGLSRREIVAKIQQSTRRLAKRQLTWFRRMPIEWIPVTAETDPGSIARQILGRVGG